MTEEPKKSFNYFLLLPPLIFAGLATMFYVGLQRENPNDLPSEFIGRTAPAVNLTDLREDPAPVDADFRNGNMQLVNFWASWCAPCRAEAPMLERMADEMGISIIGINYKDQPTQAHSFLRQFGDPFIKIGADFSGRNAIEWGVTGVPETFILDGDGKILLRYPGPITQSVLTNRILPLLNAAPE
ncbi:MAG: DsbE family thiol:disulfide interchange protein [Rhodobacteraceae bacterium]|nr:DsbE family thiol:disulfide interchange protein [Paracoccaceae bacterium]